MPLLEQKQINGLETILSTKVGGVGGTASQLAFYSDSSTITSSDGLIYHDDVVLQVGDFTRGAGVNPAIDGIITDRRIRASGGINFRTPLVGDNILNGIIPIGNDLAFYSANALLVTFGGGGANTDPIIDIGSGFNPLSGSANKSIIDINVNNQSGASYSGDVYGLKLTYSSLGDGSGKNYGIYQENESVDNYFNGDIGIGQTASTAKLHIKGSGSTTATKSLLIQNSTDVVSLQVDDLGNVFNHGPNADTRSTFFGLNAGYLNTSIGNSAFGVDAGRQTTGSYNTSMGWRAGYNLTSGYENTSVGMYAGYHIGSGFQNVYMGRNSGYNNSASYNIAIGYSALEQVSLSSATSASTAIGWRAGFRANGSLIAIGYRSGTDQEGSNSIYIGNDSGNVSQISTLTNCTLIGNATNVRSKAGDTFTTSTAIGAGATITEDRQVVFGGSGNNNNYIESVYFGKGAQSEGDGSFSSSVKISGTNVENDTGTNKSHGGTLTITGGSGTGTGSGQNLVLAVAPSGASSSVQNAITPSMTILGSTGDIGIGTGTPTTKLHLSGTASSTFRLVDTNEGAGKVLTSDADGYATWETPTSGGGGGTVSGTINTVGKFTSSDVIGDSNITDTGSLITLASDVGIGSVTATSRLHVRGSGTSSSTTSFTVEDSTGTDLFIIRDNGNVGIGTATPTAKLHVESATIADGVKITNTSSVKDYTIGVGTPSVSFNNLSIQQDGVRVFGINNDGRFDIISNTNVEGDLELKWGQGLGLVSLFDANYEQSMRYNVNGRTIAFNNRAAAGNPDFTFDWDGTVKGNVGIGITSPTAKLHVQTSTSSPLNNALLVQNGLTNDLLVVKEDGQVYSYGRSTVTSSTAFGKDTLNSLTTGIQNTVFGESTGKSLTSGGRNCLIGWNAGTSLQTGGWNTFIGHNTGSLAVGANSNTIIGFNMATSVSGSHNILVGYSSATSLTSGSRNVIVGRSAGLAISSGSDNVFIGNEAGTFETGSNKLFIDNKVRGDETNARASALIYGEFNATVSNQVLAINAGAVRLSSLPTTPSPGDVLQSVDVDGNLDWVTPSSGGGGTVSGTINTVGKFTSSDTMGDSNITDTGTLITLASDTIITGNFTVNGTTSTINTENSVISDALIELSNGTTGSPTKDSGFIVERGSSTNVGFIWDESDDVFSMVNTTDTASASTVNISSYADLKVNSIELVSGSGVTGSVLTDDGSGNGVWTPPALGKYSEQFDASAETLGVAKTITHSLGTVGIVIQLWDDVTGTDIDADFTNRTTNSVDVTFNGSLPSGNVTMIIIG